MGVAGRRDNPDGSYSVAQWRDADGSPVEQEQAVSVEIVEYDASGRETERTYARIPAGTTILVSDNNGPLGTITRTSGGFVAEPTELADLVEARLRRGSSLDEAFRELSSWSNGWLTTTAAEGAAERFGRNPFSDDRFVDDDGIVPVPRDPNISKFVWQPGEIDLE